MKNIIFVLLIFLSFDSFSQEKWLIYIEEYTILTERKRVSLVFQFTTDSVITYVPHYGYFKWKIKENFLSKDEYFYIIDKGNIKLSYKNHKSELIISRINIIQLLWLDGDPPVLLIIEFKRKDYKF